MIRSSVDSVSGVNPMKKNMESQITPSIRQFSAPKAVPFDQQQPELDAIVAISKFLCVYYNGLQLAFYAIVLQLLTVVVLRAPQLQRLLAKKMMKMLLDRGGGAGRVPVEMKPRSQIPPVVEGIRTRGWLHQAVLSL